MQHKSVCLFYNQHQQRPDCWRGHLELKFSVIVRTRGHEQKKWTWSLNFLCLCPLSLILIYWEQSIGCKAWKTLNFILPFRQVALKFCLSCASCHLLFLSLVGKGPTWALREWKFTCPAKKSTCPRWWDSTCFSPGSAYFFLQFPGWKWKICKDQRKLTFSSCSFAARCCLLLVHHTGQKIAWKPYPISRQKGSSIPSSQGTP